ncbi:MAG: gliding motility protein GldN [Bacteroidetes bacterium]|nr:MAG: gliding motility protein GldN [Bacteroidota bacterium]TAG90437.1 MAG: gliding motility protein GldN [Bacteroidota bacterium]
MKKLSVKLCALLLFVALFITQSAHAQFGAQGYNPNSVRPILESDIMFRTTVWRRINLLEKQNMPFFSRDNEITRVIIEGVKAKKLQPYNTTSGPRLTGFETPLSEADFNRNFKYFDTNLQDSIEVKPENLTTLEIKEDYIFDRRRSLRYWDIQSVTLVIPQGSTPGTQMGDLPFANFKFKDLYNYFKETYETSQEKGSFEEVRAHWYNPENPRRHMSLSDAFDLRLFSSRIFKVSNPKDDDINVIVNAEYANDPKATRKILEMSQKTEYDLMEFEHNLWEF